MSSSQNDTQVVTRVKPRTDIEPPKDFNVLYVNDEVTTMEFVVRTLMEIFDHSMDNARKLTQMVHEEGAAVVATLPFEIAEHKGTQVITEARREGYPLQVKIEPVS